MKSHFNLLLLIGFLFSGLFQSLNSFSQTPLLCETDSCRFTGFGDDMRLLWIPGLPGPNSDNYNTTESSLSFDEFNDGTCHLYGEVYNHLDASYGFYVDVWFQHKHTWTEWAALGRGWKGDELMVQNNYEDWDYYIVDEIKVSSLTGIGGFEDSYLTLSHQPASYLYGLQVGLAANDQNTEPGLSCWLYYEGEVLGQDVSGSSDIIGEGTCSQLGIMECLADVELECGEELSFENSGIPLVTCPGYTLSYSDSYISDCPVVIIREWTASNSDGDEVICLQQITAPDLSTPEFSENFENIEVSIFPDIDSLVLIVLDNCSNVSIVTTVTELGTETADCGQFRTQTPGGWGAPANGNNPGMFRDANFDLAFPNTLVVGCETTLTLTSPSDVESFLPSGGTPSILFENLTNPAGYGNSLAGHLVAITLTLGFDELFEGFGESEQLLKNQIFIGGPFNGWRIEDIVITANEVFGGCNTTYSPSQMVETLSSINENYVDGEIDNGDVLCTDSTEECAETYVVSYIASDECGNTTTVNQIIVVQSYSVIDSDNCPDDIIVECDAIPLAHSIEFSFSCGLVLNGVLTEEMLNGDCLGSYTIIRTWTASNDLGVIFECSQQIVVVDNTPPVFLNIPDDVTVECGENTPVDIVAEDGCFAIQVNIQTIDAELSGNCFPVVQRTFIAEDACGNIATHIQYITIVDTEAPEVMNTPVSLELECGESVPFYTPEATDNCAEELFIELVENESTIYCGYVLEQVWTITDACSNTSIVSRTVTFTDSTAPYLNEDLVAITLECSEELVTPHFQDNCTEFLVIEITEPILSNCNESGEVIYLVTDNCGNSSEFSILVTRVDTLAPEFPVLDSLIEVACGNESNIPFPEVTDCSEVTISYTDMAIPTNGCPESVRTWVAEDACGNTSMASQVLLLIDSEAPVFLYELENIETSCSNIPEALAPDVSDACDDIAIVYSEEIVPLSCGAELTRTWEATDNCGNISELVQVITIVDEDAPVINGEDILEVSCGTQVEELIQIEDDCEGYLTASFTDEFIFNSDCESSVIRTYTATDLCANTSTFIQSITFVDNEAPVFAELSTIYLECENDLASVPFPNVTDNCSSVQITFEDNVEIIICNTSIIRTWIAQDECGNQVQQIQNIEIEDSTSPVFTNVPENLIFSCGEEVPEVVAPDVEDNCSDVQLVFNEVTNDSLCTAWFAVLRTWTATDACGNSVTVTQQITVSDDEPPVFDQQLMDVTLACGEELIPPVVTASDDCGGVVFVAYNQDNASGGCPNIFRTWTATDACGNTAVMTQTLFIEDNEPPLISGIIFALEATCENIPDLPIPFVSDNCDENVDVTVSESVNGTGCEQMLIRTWIATDDCGNTNIATQSISLIDETPPLFLNPISEGTVECSQLDDLPLPEVADNCGGEVSITFSDEAISEGCEAEILRTYIATDLCGNSAALTHIIHVIDLSPPLFAGILAGTFVDCSSIPPAITPTVSDACNSDDLEIIFSEQYLGEGCSYTILRRWEATDACGNQVVAQRYIFVQDDEAPVLSALPEDEFILCGAVLPEVPVIVATDNCSVASGVEFTESFEYSDCGIVITRNWSSVDACGNVVSHSQNIEITDSEAPEFLEFPADITINCSQIPSLGLPVVIDNCDTDLEVYFEDEIILGGCPYFILRTFLVADNCGNESSRAQTITVTDNQAPSFDFLPENFSSACGDLPVPYQMTASDNCSAIPEIEFSEELLGEGCMRQLRRTWMAQDYCGNITYHVQLIDLVDSGAPVPGVYDIELVFECNENFNLPDVEFFDDCFELEIAYSEENLASECSSTYDIFRNWTATDACGNSIVVSQVIHVVDTNSPELNIEDEEITVACNDIPDIPTLAIFGECGDFETEYSEEVTYLEELENTCELGNAESLGSSVAIWLPTLNAEGADFVFGEEAGLFSTDYDGGDIHITGQVYNSVNPNQSWILDLILTDKQNWDTWSNSGGSYKDDLGIAGDNYLEWDYYKLSNTSRLIGAVEFEGSELSLTHIPVDYTYGFQVGRGANNRNTEYGISGWFFYEGDLNGDFSFGSGDLIAEIKCCPDQDIVRTWTAEDCSGNGTTVTQIIHVREELVLAAVQSSQLSIAEFDVVNTDGQDFIISFDSGDDVYKSLIMMDLSGRVVHEVTYSGLEKDTRYTRRIEKNSFSKGMYMFYLKGRRKIDSDKELNIR
jgi:hypothetical protein